MTSGSSSPRPTMPFWWLIVASFLGDGNDYPRHGWSPGGGLEILLMDSLV